jgi:hypothetical protein
MNVPEILEKAAEVVAQGWYQGDYTDGEGNFCSLGAIYVAAGWMDREGNFDSQGRDVDDRTILNSAISTVDRQLGAEGYPRHFTLSTWNDESWRSQEDVVLMFKKAAATARED